MSEATIFPNGLLDNCSPNYEMIRSKKTEDVGSVRLEVSVSSKYTVFSAIVILGCLPFALQQQVWARGKIVSNCPTLTTNASFACGRKAYDDATHWALVCYDDGTVFCCHTEAVGGTSCSRVQGLTRGSGGSAPGRNYPPPNVGVMPPHNPPSKIGVRPPASGGSKTPPSGGGTTVGVKPIMSPPSNSGNEQPPSGGTTTIYERSGGKH